MQAHEAFDLGLKAAERQFKQAKLLADKSFDPVFDPHLLAENEIPENLKQDFQTGFQQFINSARDSG